MSCGVDQRCGSDPVLLCVLCRRAATAPDSVPSLGTSVCHGCGPKNAKKKQKKKKCCPRPSVKAKNKLINSE